MWEGDGARRRRVVALWPRRGRSGSGTGASREARSISSESSGAVQREAKLEAGVQRPPLAPVLERRVWPELRRERLGPRAGRIEPVRVSPLRTGHPLSTFPVCSSATCPDMLRQAGHPGGDPNWRGLESTTSPGPERRSPSPSVQSRSSASSQPPSDPLARLGPSFGRINLPQRDLGLLPSRR